MKEIDVDELKLIQLKMLKDIHSFCVEHDIKYSLAFGTLLGAVRHKGYIPWDDDIDIMMPREDYSRFIQTYKNDIYEIADLSINSRYGLPFAKVIDSRTIMDEFVEGGSEYGVYIDVFPVDNVPDNVSDRQLFYHKKSLLNVLFNLKTVKVSSSRSVIKNMILFIGHIFLSFIRKQYLANCMSNLATKYVGAKTAYVGIVAPADSRIEEIIPSSFFEEYVQIPFENLCVMSIREFDKYLTAAYGDYMQLPPIEKRVSHHVYKAYWK